MKNQFIRCGLVASLLLAAVSLQAQPSAHYVPGVEGIKAASLPPPGIYARDYNVFYFSDKANDPSGNDATPPGFEAFTYGNVPRVIWITDVKVLGGYLGADALIPLLYQHLEVPGYDDGNFGAGDLFAEATLSWHLKQFDFAIGAGAWMPTGDSGEPTDAGLGYWTPMFTAGATWYIDKDKTWAVSALNRYEINTEQRDYDYTPGDAYTLEWGISKTLGKVYDVGVIGYYQQQVTADSNGSNAERDRVAAVGPEFSVVFPKQMLFISARYAYEFMSEARAQGHTVALTLTKAF
jgi:hypothetical protein